MFNREIDDLFRLHCSTLYNIWVFNQSPNAVNIFLFKHHCIIVDEVENMCFVMMMKAFFMVPCKYTLDICERYNFSLYSSLFLMIIVQIPKVLLSLSLVPQPIWLFKNSELILINVHEIIVYSEPTSWNDSQRTYWFQKIQIPLTLLYIFHSVERLVRKCIQVFRGILTWWRNLD